MTIVTFACVLAGMAAGLRFKVLAIVPLTLAGMLATAAVMLAQGEPGWATLGAVALTAVGAQVGYLCGTFAQAMLRDSPAPAAAIPSRVAPAYKPQRGVGISTQ